MVFNLIGQQHTPLKFPEHLIARSAEVIALDSTVFNLHRFLAGRYPATNKCKAAAKLHAIISIFYYKLNNLIFICH